MLPILEQVVGSMAGLMWVLSGTAGRSRTAEETGDDIDDIGGGDWEL